jgi:hypothetical protein
MDANFHFVLDRKGLWHWHIADSAGVPVVMSTTPLRVMADHLPIMDAIIEQLAAARASIVDA